MNALASLFNLLNQLPTSLEQALLQAETYETKLQDVSGQVSTYQSKALTFVEGLFKDLPNQISMTGIQTALKNNTHYQAIKDQPITTLFSLPEGFDETDDVQMQSLVTNKLTELKTYLTPLNINNSDAIFEKLGSLGTQAMNMPEDLDFDDQNMVEAFQAMKLNQLQPEIEELVALLMGKVVTDAAQEASAESHTTESTADDPATTETNPDSSSTQMPELDTLLAELDTLLAELEKFLPELEAQMNAMEQQEMSVDTASTSLQNLMPLMHQMGTAMIPGAELPFSATQANPIIENLAAEAKKLEAPVEEYMTQAVLNVLASLCQQYIPKDSPFEVLTEVVQKVQQIVNYLIEKGLWVPITFDSDEASLANANNFYIPPAILQQMDQGATGPQPVASTNGTGATTQASETTPTTTSTTATATTAESAGNATSTATNTSAHTTTGTGTGASTSEPLFPKSTGTGLDALLQNTAIDGLGQLSATHQQTAQGWVSGEAFTPATGFVSSIEAVLTEKLEIYLGEEAQLPTWKTLDELVTWLLTELKAIADAIITDLESLVKEIINLLGSAIQLLLDLILVIKVPEGFLQAIWPDIKNTNDANLLCLLVALPWDIVKNLWETEVG